MTELTHATFREFVCANRFAAIHFWAAWNNYETEMKAILRSQIPPELAGQIAFAAFSVDPVKNHEIVR
jgi:hypothetical protein